MLHGGLSWIPRTRVGALACRSLVRGLKVLEEKTHPCLKQTNQRQSAQVRHRPLEDELSLGGRYPSRLVDASYRAR